MKFLNIKLIAFLLLTLGMAATGMAQEENSYYFNPRKGQKPLRMKPYIDSAHLPKTDTFEVVLMGERPAPLAPRAPQPQDSTLSTPKPQTETPIKPEN